MGIGNSIATIPGIIAPIITGELTPNVSPGCKLFLPVGSWMHIIIIYYPIASYGKINWPPGSAL
jgi:hypothetical protein